AGFRGFGVCRDIDSLNRLDALRRFELFVAPPPPAQDNLPEPAAPAPEPPPVADEAPAAPQATPQPEPIVEAETITAPEATAE
ncbi:hypothetical protein ACI4AP_28680, partial [Klebsiella pneumoniae]